MSELLHGAWIYWHGGGPLMLPLAAVCFFLIYYLTRCRICLYQGMNNARYAGREGVRRDEETPPQLRRDFMMIIALTSAAPLLGLLGTVTGMIETFDGVSSAADGVGRQMADGISQALITTQVGLVVAIPGLFGLSRLRRLLDQWAIQQELERKMEIA